MEQEKQNSNVQLSKDEARIILSGLAQEKQTLFWGSTAEQYAEYHSKIDLLMDKIRKVD